MKASASHCSGRTGGSPISICSPIPWSASPNRVRRHGAAAERLPCESKLVRPNPPPCRRCCRGSPMRRELLMNYYGEMARQHWARWLPRQYEAIEDPDSFFLDLGNRVSDRIAELADQFAGDSPPG